MCGRKFAPIKVFFGFCKECLKIKEDRRGAKQYEGGETCPRKPITDLLVQRGFGKMYS